MQLTGRGCEQAHDRPHDHNLGACERVPRRGVLHWGSSARLQVHSSAVFEARGLAALIEHAEERALPRQGVHLRAVEEESPRAEVHVAAGAVAHHTPVRSEQCQADIGLADLHGPSPGKHGVGGPREGIAAPADHGVVGGETAGHFAIAVDALQLHCRHFWGHVHLPVPVVGESSALTPRGANAVPAAVHKLGLFKNISARTDTTAAGAKV